MRFPHATAPLRELPFLQGLIDVWSDTRLIVLVAQTAAIYAAVLIPFKVGIPLIPGFVELRPANALPIVASLLFGPAAAWGAGIGNLIGDCFGTLGPGSLFGFVGNVCYGYLPYLLWGRLGPFSSGSVPEPRSWRQWLELALVCGAASLACALVIAWGVELFGLLPFWALAPPIFLNNFVMGVLLAPPLLLFLHPRVKRWGLRYEDIIRCRVPADFPGHRVPGPWHEEACLVMARNVRFTYAEATQPALDGLSLTVHRGEAVVIMGRSGAGKSTFCYTLNGLIPLHIVGSWSGQLTIDGCDSTGQPVWEQAGRVGMLFQDFEAQLVSTSVEKELALPLEHLSSRLPPAEMALRIERALAQVGLSELKNRNPLLLSGGQRQRLALATVLIREPPLLVLDEPLTDLDPEARRLLTSLLVSLKKAGITSIAAEHDPDFAATADRLCVLDQGHLVWEGPPRRLFADPDLPPRLGVPALPLAQCFAGLHLPEPPITVEEAWQAADDYRLSVEPAEPYPERRPANPYGPIILDLHRVSYEYEPGTPALSDVSFSIREGEFVAIIGRNGSGKSTLATLLNGLKTPTRGYVRVVGEDIRRRGPGSLATTIGYVFQNPDHQIFAETVAEEVAFGARNLSLPEDECERRVSEALRAVGLDDLQIREQDPFSLTKGDRQRVAVASILAARPRILIFDEPTTGLDAEGISRMMEMLRRLNEQGRTIIMITHALGLAAAYAHRCLVMHEGRLALDGPTRQVFRMLLDPERSASLGVEPPPITRFAARWGHTLLTVEEVRAAIRRK